VTGYQPIYHSTIYSPDTESIVKVTKQSTLSYTTSTVNLTNG
jgi:hypothetical protein